MKTIYTHLKSIGFYVLLLAGTTIFVYSCKKDSDDASNTELTQLKVWYKSMVTKNKNEFTDLEPHWNSIYANKQGRFTVYEVTLSKPNALVLSADGIKVKEKVSKVNLRLLLFEDNVSKKVKYASYMYVEDNYGQIINDIHYKSFGKLTGRVVYYHQNGQMANGWIYKDGKAEAGTSSITEKEYMFMRQNKLSALRGAKLMTETRTECEGTLAETYFWGCTSVNNGDKTCSWHYKGTTYITVCRVVRDVASDLPQDEGDGGYVPPVNYDCSGDENGSAFYTDECGCIGGNTGIQSCADITDKIKNKCLDSVWVKIRGNLDDKITNILKNTFGTSDKINFKIVDGNIDGGYSAKTEVVIDKVNSEGIHVFDVKVTLNKSTLPSASQEFIATTIVHEIMHAYFDSQKTYYTQQFQQHRDMAENYIDDLKNAVQAIYSSLDDKAAYALILNGFGDIFKNDLTYWDNLVSKYDLDTGQIINIRDNYKSHNSGTKTECSQ